MTVAAEMNLSETAFAHPLPAGGEADWALRWFTPVVEEKLCGHATLATAHALRSDRGTAGNGELRQPQRRSRSRTPTTTAASRWTSQPRH